MRPERPCFCGRAFKGVLLDKHDASVPEDKKQCVFCWNALNDPEYQRLWRLDEFGEPLAPQSKKAVRRMTAAQQGTGSCCGGQKNTDYSVALDAPKPGQ